MNELTTTIITQTKRHNIYAYIIGLTNPVITILYGQWKIYQCSWQFDKDEIQQRNHHKTPRCLNIGPWASYQIRKIAGCTSTRNAGNVSRHRFQRKPLVSDPGMHHGTCVTHVSWCMSGLLAHGGGESVSGIPGACATRNFKYLARCPCRGFAPFHFSLRQDNNPCGQTWHSATVIKQD